MEKQIQILTSELSQLKNSYNKVTKLRIRKSFTIAKPNDTIATRYWVYHVIFMIRRVLLI